MDELAHALGHGPARVPPEEPEGRRACAPCSRPPPSGSAGARRSRRPARGFGLAGGVGEGQLRRHLRRGRGRRGRAARCKVARAVTAFECGAIVNPDHLRNQVEGCGRDGPRRGAVRGDRSSTTGKILNPRFSRYRVPRFRDAPDPGDRAARPQGPALRGRRARRRSSPSPRRSRARSSRRRGRGGAACPSRPAASARKRAERGLDLRPPEGGRPRPRRPRPRRRLSPARGGRPRRAHPSRPGP